MRSTACIKHIEHLLSATVKATTPVFGGDISQAYKIETKNGLYFLKLNCSDKHHMFQTEAIGLELISSTNTIKTPKVLAHGCVEASAFLLMEYIEPKTPSASDLKKLAIQLAALHKCTHKAFGLEHNNFIGSLNQSNATHHTWLDFYTQERLLPQFNLAITKGLLNAKETPSPAKLKDTLKPWFKTVKPSLLHGDLWHGNFIISKQGIPYLIDPAVYYGHNEVDIALSKLFGGFHTTFYDSYFKTYPPDTHTTARIELYQLYYLLAHLNMFGTSYYQSVKNTLLKYF